MQSQICESKILDMWLYTTIDSENSGLNEMLESMNLHNVTMQIISWKEHGCAQVKFFGKENDLIKFAIETLLDYDIDFKSKMLRGMAHNMLFGE